jgi:hypothetical protein
MRDLINIIESVGLANRKPGDRWRSPRGDELVFSDLTFYPQQGGKYETPEEFQAALDQAMQQRGIATPALKWENPVKNTGGFGIAHFVDDQNRDVYLGRWYNEINPNRSQNRWNNDLPSGFTLQTGAAQKERAGYQPSEVLRGNMQNLTPDAIYSAVVTKFGQNSDEARAMAAYMASDGTVEFPAGKMNFAAFTNYFCEMLQPMALVMGKKRKGNANEAEARYLTQGGYSTCRISFSTKKNEGLFDSVLTNAAGQSIGISTKAKGGAKASVKNLDDKVREMQTTDDGRKVLERFPKEVSLLNLIVDGGQVGAPLNLGVLFNIITPEQQQEILGTRKLGPQQIAGKLSPGLQKIYNYRSPRDASKVVPFYHLVASVAYQVADHVNNNTRFSQAASAILNHGAFMQAYTQASQRGSMILLDQFDFDYPCEAVTGVLLSAKKPYYSTGMKGNFTFQILKNGATVEEVMEDSEDDNKSNADSDQLGHKSLDLHKPADVEKNLGRKRRGN